VALCHGASKPRLGMASDFSSSSVQRLSNLHNEMVKLRVSAQAARQVLDVRSVAMYSQRRVPDDSDNMQSLKLDRVLDEHIAKLQGEKDNAGDLVQQASLNGLIIENLTHGVSMQCNKAGGQEGVKSNLRLVKVLRGFNIVEIWLNDVRSTDIILPGSRIAQSSESAVRSMTNQSDDDCNMNVDQRLPIDDIFPDQHYNDYNVKVHRALLIDDMEGGGCDVTDGSLGVGRPMLGGEEKRRPQKEGDRGTKTEIVGRGCGTGTINVKDRVRCRGGRKVLAKVKFEDSDKVHVFK
jgi:hypothetical protein